MYFFTKEVISSKYFDKYVNGKTERYILTVIIYLYILIEKVYEYAKIKLSKKVVIYIKRHVSMGNFLLTLNWIRQKFMLDKSSKETFLYINLDTHGQVEQYIVKSKKIY